MLIIAIYLASLVSCGNNNSHNRQEHGAVIYSVPTDSGSLVPKERVTTQDWGFDTDFDTISFFGKPVVMDNWTSILHQIRVIASEDDMLCYESGVDYRTLSVGKVKFGVNVHGDEIILISGTEVDDPKMKQAFEYLKGIYGTPEEDEPYNYWWHIVGRYHVQTVRMRSLRCSEEGGTVLLFYLNTRVWQTKTN